MKHVKHKKWGEGKREEVGYRVGNNDKYPTTLYDLHLFTKSSESAEDLRFRRLSLGNKCSDRNM